MTLIQRRIYATAIDFIIIAFVLAFLQLVLPEGYFTKTFFLITILLLYSTKDLIFRNAGIGKKIMGLIVTDKEGNQPSLTKLILRNLPTFVLLWYEFMEIKSGKIRFGDELADTRVVYKK